jgi:hypothetical protein
MFFMCSFPLAAGLLAIMAWTILTLLRMFLDMRASATAGDAITARRARRQAAKQTP